MSSCTQTKSKQKEIKNEKLIKCFLVCDLHFLTGKKKNQIKGKNMCKSKGGKRLLYHFLLNRLFSVTV